MEKQHRYKVMASEAKAQDLAADTKLFSELSSEYFEIDFAAEERGGKFYAPFLPNMNLQKYASDIVDEVEKLPEEALFDQVKATTDMMNEEGFDLYKAMFSDININGGLGGTIDGGMAAYININPIRNMLKDGAFVYALRFYTKNIEPSGLVDAYSSTKYKSWIRAIAKKYWPTPSDSEAVMDATLDAVETAESL